MIIYHDNDNIMDMIQYHYHGTGPTALQLYQVAGTFIMNYFYILLTIHSSESTLANAPKAKFGVFGISVGG